MRLSCAKAEFEHAPNMAHAPAINAAAFANFIKIKINRFLLRHARQNPRRCVFLSPQKLLANGNAFDFPKK